MIASSLSIMADAVDISSVPADYVKNFLIMAAFVLGVMLAHKAGTKAAGSAADPLHLNSPLDIREAVSFADKKGTAQSLQKIEETIQALTRENLRQHNASAAQIAGIIAAGEQRSTKILSSLASTEARMMSALMKELQGMHERVNPLAERVAASAQLIEWIKGQLQWLHDQLVTRLDRASAAQAEEARRLNSRMDDAIRIAKK
jgi:hypothetical protein